MSLEKVAKHLASKGRGEDTLLVHMTPGEVHGLQALAKAHGGSLTVNPDTGLPEAGFLKSILPTLVGVGMNFILPGSGLLSAGIGAGVGALTNRQNPLMGALMGGLGAYGGASLAANIGSGLNAASSAVAAEGATAAGSTPMATTGLETVSPEVWAGQPLPQPVTPPVAVPQPVAPTVAESMQAPMETEFWPAGAHTPPVKPTFGQSLEAAFQKPGEFVKGAGGFGKLLSPAMMAAAPLTMMEPEITTRRRYSGEGGEYEYIPGYTDGAPSSSSYTGERRYFAPTYRKLAEGGEVTPAPQIISMPVDPQQTAGLMRLAAAQQPFVAAPAAPPSARALPQNLMNLPTQYGSTLSPNVEPQRIKEYVQTAMGQSGLSSLQRSALLDKTAQEYGVSREQVAQATGYSMPTVQSLFGPMQGGIAPVGGMTGASADAFRYLYGAPTTTAERVTQPIITANTSQIGGAAPPAVSQNYTDPTTGRVWSPSEIATGGYYERYTEGGGDSGEQEYSRWVPAPKIPAPVDPISTDAADYVLQKGKKGYLSKLAEAPIPAPTPATTPAPTPAPTSSQPQYSNAEIKDYVNNILNDPSMTDAQRAAAINKAAAQYGVSRTRLAEATGYSIQQVEDYLGKLAEAPTPAPARPTVSSDAWTPEQIAAGGRHIEVPWGDEGGKLSKWVPYSVSAPTPIPAPTPPTVSSDAWTPEQIAAGGKVVTQRVLQPDGRYVDEARWVAAPRTVNYAAGGGLRSGGFVVPADVVSALGNGSTDAGLEVLMRKFNAKPIDGPGDGMSDSIPTTIEGKQKARVARGEAYISPEDVKKYGGSKKFYAMLDKIRHNAHGKKSQQRQVNPNKLV